MNKKSVKIVCVLLVAIFIIWDIWLAVDGIPDNTVTAVVRTMTEGYETIGAGIIGLIAGSLIGHFWK